LFYLGTENGWCTSLGWRASSVLTWPRSINDHPFPKRQTCIEWLVYFPRVESQLCACLEPRLGRKLADAELVVLMQVSYDPGARRPFGLHLVVTNRLPARGWGLRQKRCLPFLLRGLSTSLSLRHSVSLTCQVWNQLRIELPRSRTP